MKKYMYVIITLFLFLLGGFSHGFAIVFIPVAFLLGCAQVNEVYKNKSNNLNQHHVQG